jgi:hypothetical protein
MNTKVSPTWIFRLLIFATLALGVTLRFAAPMLADRLLESPPKLLGKHAGEVIQRHKEIVAGSAEIIKGLGEALFIAAILAAIVDPYTKFRLGKEIGREIAHETAGQHLPQPLRQALENIEDISLYQVDFAIEVTLENVASPPDFLKWKTAMHFEVRNASWNKRVFEHRVAIMDSAAERADGKIIAVSHTLDGTVEYDLKESDPALARMCNREDGITFFRHKSPRKIASTRLGTTHKYEYSSVTERLVAPAEVQAIQLLRPAVGIVLTVRHPAGIIIRTSLQHIDEVTPETPSGETPGRAALWKSERAYLTNEHIWIMYENPKPAETRPDPSPKEPT